MEEIGSFIIDNEPELVSDLVDFFASKDANPQSFEIIKAVCLPQAIKMNRPNAQVFMNLGYLSLMDFLTYRQEVLKRSSGVKTDLAFKILDLLVKHSLLLPNELTVSDGMNKLYTSSGPRVKFLYDRQLIENLIGGWQFIIKKYSRSVFKIEVKDSLGDYSIGTGYYFAVGNETTQKHLVVTNKHVVEDSTRTRLLDIDDNELQFEEILCDSKRDLAFLILNGKLECPYLEFNVENKPLEEILTIGYPSIPGTKGAYQVYHLGEVNSFVKDYESNKLFLISAKTSSGNSGSPVINKYGMVEGIVTRELYEKDALIEKGKLPYYAAIPTIEIIQSINDNVLI